MSSIDSTKLKNKTNITLRKTIKPIIILKIFVEIPVE